MRYNIPELTWSNLFTIDKAGQILWEHWLGKDYSAMRPHFERMGLSGALATPLSRIADRLSPQLITHDELGARIDRVEYHPAYQKLRELSYGQRIVSIKYDREFLARYRHIRHLAAFGAAYYFAQTETGLFCPICMTDALGRALERHGNGDLVKETLRHIGSEKLSDVWEGAMFMTERQGGSDVGANIVQAVKEGERWLLNGHKWFCSNVDAKAILALARMPGAPVASGTKGLGLFLILREHPSDNSNTMRIERLKDKLGVRAMASGEVTLENTQAFLIGGEGEGFKFMADMVNMSRLYNAVASLGISRRAILEAVAYGRERQAFGQRLVDLPLWRTGMADLVAEHWGVMHLVFTVAQLLDQGDGGSIEGGKASRLLTPLAKALAAKFSMFAASESMEAIGGNAYIEEHILPRLLRDAQVLPIWEGTTNIQCLDFLRALNKEGLDCYFHRIDQALDGARADLRVFVEDKLKKFKTELGALRSLSRASVERRTRLLSELAGRILTLALLLETAKNPKLEALSLASFRRLLARGQLTAPVAAFDSESLAQDEAVLLDSVFVV